MTNKKPAEKVNSQAGYSFVRDGAKHSLPNQLSPQTKPVDWLELSLQFQKRRNRNAGRGKR